MHHLCPLLTKKSQTQRRSILPTHQKKDGSCSSVGQSVPFVIFFCKNGGPGFYRKKKIRNMGYARCSRNVRPSPYSIPIPQGDAWTRFSLTRLSRTTSLPRYHTKPRHGQPRTPPPEAIPPHSRGSDGRAGGECCTGSPGLRSSRP